MTLSPAVIADQMPIFNRDYAICHERDVFVMGDDDKRLLRRLLESRKSRMTSAEFLLSRLPVGSSASTMAGGVHKRSANRDALLLPAR